MELLGPRDLGVQSCDARLVALLQVLGSLLQARVALLLHRGGIRQGLRPIIRPIDRRRLQDGQRLLHNGELLPNALFGGVARRTLQEPFEPKYLGMLCFNPLERLRRSGVLLRFRGSSSFLGSGVLLLTAGFGNIPSCCPLKLLDLAIHDLATRRRRGYRSTRRRGYRPLFLPTF
jgi:hypothetical protein